MPLERIVCLANSYKHENRCVAGISLISRRWIRLVEDTARGCLTRERTCYADGTEAAILDVMEAETGERCATPSHPEDVRVTAQRWERIRRFDQPRDAMFLAAQVKKGPALLGGCGDRLYAGRTRAAQFASSLELIHPEDLWWWIREEKGKRKNRALFRLGGVGRVRYDLALTDPRWLEALHPVAPGIYPHSFFFKGAAPDTYLTVSLSEEFEHFHYKLVAGVIVSGKTA